MPPELSDATLAALALCGLIAGIGITAVGPGGVLVTIGLFALTRLSPAEVAGTAIVTHVATGAAGTAAYVRSGQLREASTRRMAAVLLTAAAVGTPAGVLVNAQVSADAFGALLGLCVAAIGVLVLLRERRGDAPVAGAAGPGGVAVAGIGAGVAVAGGLFGVGGPLLSIPLLVLAGVPMLPALGAAQAQSIVIAAVGTIAYAAQDAISWPLALLVGVPELAGVVIGWRVAHALPTHRLRYGLAAALVALGPYLVLRGG
jgi:uncharacterized protein